jgi:hypothetical protein
MSDYTCGGSLCKFIAKLLSLQGNEVLCPRLKFISGGKIGNKIQPKIAKFEAQIATLQDEKRKLPKTSVEEIKVIDAKIKKLRNQEDRIKNLSDIIDISHFKFVDELFRAVKVSTNDEELINNILDPELKGLMALLSNKDVKFEDVLAQYEFGAAKQDFKSFVNEVRDIVQNVKKYKPKIFNALIAKKVYKEDSKINFVESKKYCLNKYNPCFEACFKGYVKGKKIEELVKEGNAENLCKNIYSVLELNNYNDLPKEKKEELQEGFKILNDISKNKFECTTIKEFVVELVKIINELKKLHLEDIFLKSLIKHTQIQLSNQAKYKLLHASAVKFVEKDAAKYKDEKDIEMEFEESEFKNMINFDELTSMKNYATFGSIQSLNLSCKLRAAVGVRLISEILRTLQVIELAHHGKDGFVVSITY